LALLAFAVSHLAQATSDQNPFPELGLKKDSEVFDLTKQVMLSGIVTQPITRPERASGPVLYFRMDARAPASGAIVNWTVRVKTGLPDGFDLETCSLCLVNDYLPEMAKLTAGMMVTIMGNPANDNSPRLSLVPARGASTIAGITVIAR
jgi:hypothetical protein